MVLHKNAVASLVFGILSYIFGGFPVLGWILVSLAIGLGVMVLRRGNKEGRPYAIAGILVGTVVLFGLIAGLVYRIIASPD